MKYEHKITRQPGQKKGWSSHGNNTEAHEWQYQKTNSPYTYLLRGTRH